MAVRMDPNELWQRSQGVINQAVGRGTEMLADRIEHYGGVATDVSEMLREKGEKFGISEGAIVAMTPDGVVRALVGGRSYAESQFNRAIAAKRQPGSAFKPFVYLTALEHGLTPDTVRDDAPIAVKGWKPENYEHEFMGPVTLTTALAT